MTQLKKYYTSHEVSELTGLTARQLQWWDMRRLFRPAMASRPTGAGGFTRRRYTPMDVLELQVLADLRRRGFTVAALRRLLTAVHDQFGVRLFEAIGEGGPLTLFVDGGRIFARTAEGLYFNLTENPKQPLLVLGEDLHLRALGAPASRRPTRRARSLPEGREGSQSRARRKAPESRTTGQTSGTREQD